VWIKLVSVQVVVRVIKSLEKGLKTGAVFMDLTAVYDTIWHTGLLAKLSRCLPFW